MDRSKAYEVLGLPADASEEDIKTAYRSLAQKYNIDKMENDAEKETAQNKMTEINEAFDSLMSYIRTGSTTSADGAASSGARSSYPLIRQQINDGQVDEAMRELSSIPGGASDAEWNFLMGSVYYYKGWLDQAIHYFQIAVHLEPGNREYEAALRNLQNSSKGNMEGNPYMNQDPSGAAVNCACNTCAMMCCMDACCGMCRGF